MSKKGKRLREFEKNNRQFSIRQTKKKETFEEVKTDERKKKKKKIVINIRRLAGSMIICIFIMSVGVSAIKLIQLDRERDELLEKQANLKELKEELTAELEHIDSAQYIEQQARKNLRLIKENEILFILPDEEYGEIKDENPEENSEKDGQA